MDKIAVIYWSGTGNTELMANRIADGIKKGGKSAETFFVTDFSKDKIADYDHIVFGCPSMGAEVLEEGDFDPFFTDIEASLKDKKVALFGSYGWGDGEWMRDWENRVRDAGAVLYDEGLIIQETPDSDGEEECVDFGKGFAQF